MYYYTFTLHLGVEMIMSTQYTLHLGVKMIVYYYIFKLHLGVEMKEHKITDFIDVHCA